MKILKKLEELKEFRKGINKEDIGLVPTMGNLHKGHLSLIETSFSKHQYTIVTIFVNPKQFGPNEDFANYPRTLYKDCEEIHGHEMKWQRDLPGHEVIVFAPETIEDIYPKGFSTSISVDGITQKLCGLSRPTHFEGVTTVVYRLFSLTQPETAYFGQKDYQQFLVIKKMVQDLELEIKVKACPIVRDHDGLALSSRNQYLTPPDREKALILPKTIRATEYLFQKNDFSDAQEKFKKIKEESFADQNWEYLEVYDGENLEEATADSQSLVVAGAYKSRAARLIDNTVFNLNHV